MPVGAVEQADLQEEIAQMVSYLTERIKSPQVGTTGGEWLVFGLARGNQTVPDGYYDRYFANVEKTLQDTQGILSRTKYTEYSRVIIALSAIGKDVTNVTGYNLLTKISDINNVKKQGINGPIFALIAFDTKGYEIPVLVTNEVQATREALIEEILSREVTEGTVTGGFSLDGVTPDPDVTAMALQALAPYRQDNKVAPVVERAIATLQRLQQSNGGYTNLVGTGIEGGAQVIVALCASGIDPGSSPVFTKTDAQGNTNTPVSFLLKEYKKLQEAEALSLMTVEQSLYALVAYARFLQGESPLYDMTQKIIAEGEQFFDLDGHWAKDSIETTRGFGMTNGQWGKFMPDQATTRAEFAVAVVNAFGFTSIQQEKSFLDVPQEAWFQKQILAATNCGIIKGRGDGLFDPEGKITRQEAMAIVQRSAQYLGQNTSMSSNDISVHLGKYPDGEEVAWWAMGPAGYSLKEGIIRGKDDKIAPHDFITRAETVVVMERLLQTLNKTNS
jgi:hypothetical protein